MTNIVIGTDGSQASHEAAELDTQFAVAPGDRVVIVTASPRVHDLRPCAVSAGPREPREVENAPNFEAGDASE